MFKIARFFANVCTCAVLLKFVFRQCLCQLIKLFLFKEIEQIILNRTHMMDRGLNFYVLGRCLLKGAIQICLCALYKIKLKFITFCFGSTCSRSAIFVFIKLASEQVKLWLSRN